MLPLLAVAGEPRAAEGIRASGACAVLVGRSGLGDWAREGLAAARALAVRDRAFRLVLVLLPGAPDPGDPSLAYLAAQPWVRPARRSGRRDGGGRPRPRPARRRCSRRPGAHGGRRVALPRPRGLPRGGRRPLLRPRAGRRPPDRAPAHGALRRRDGRIGKRKELAGAGRPAAGAPPRRRPRQRRVAGAGDPPRRAPPRRARRGARPPGGRRRSARPPTSPPTSAPSTWPSPGRSRAGHPKSGCSWSSTSSRRSSRSARTRASAPPSSATSSTPPRSPAVGPSSSPRCGPTSTTASRSTRRRAR